MKILVLTIEYPPLGGGASPMIHELNQQIVRAGHSVTVITMAHKNLPAHQMMDDIEVYRIQSFREHTHISYLWEHIAFIAASRRFMASLLPAHPVDFCFTHFLVPSGILAKWILGKFGIPYIVTAHGSDIPGYNPDRFYFIHRFTPRLIRSIISNSRYTVAPSKYLRSLLLGMKGIPVEKIKHIPSGIDTEYYIPGEKKQIVLATGRLLARKGFQYLIEAVADEAFPFEVHICGDGPMMKVLKEKAKHSLTPVVLHGWLHNKSEQYRSLLAEASIYVLVSAKENASTSLLEAMSSGCAVITSDVSGCPETVGEDGICIPPADVPALKAQLKSLSENHELRAQHMKQGRERAVREFSWPSIARRYLALITENQDQ